MPKDQDFSARVFEQKTVFDGMIWDVVSESFDFGEQKLTREFVRHPGAVAVVALNEADELLMIRQYRHPVKQWLWEIPAGLLDVDGESAIEAANRELIEESGYSAGTLKPLISFFTTPGGNSEEIQVFLASDLEFVGRPELLEGEEVDLKLEWVPLTNALSDVLSGNIKSPSAVVGIMAAVLRQSER